MRHVDGWTTQSGRSCSECGATGVELFIDGEIALCNPCADRIYNSDVSDVPDLPPVESTTDRCECPHCGNTFAVVTGIGGEWRCPKCRGLTCVVCRGKAVQTFMVVQGTREVPWHYCQSCLNDLNNAGAQAPGPDGDDDDDWIPGDPPWKREQP